MNAASQMLILGMGRSMVTSAAVVSLLLAASQAAATTQIYYQDFSTDPGWIADQPENFYWDSSSSAFYSRTENLDTGVAPNRYAFVRTELDPTKSWVLEWNQKVTDVGGFTRSPFGLFSDDLVASNRTYKYLPQIISKSTANIWMGGFNGASNAVGLNVVDADGTNAGFGSYGIPSFGVNTWYTNRLEYDASTNLITYSIADRDSGQVLLAGEDHGNDPIVFAEGMRYLGISNYPIGTHPNNVYTDNPTQAATALIDNVKLTGSLRPPPHFLQADETWAGDPLVGSGLSMRNYGCFVTSATMLLNQYGHDVDPGEVNAFLAATKPTNGTIPWTALAGRDQVGQSDGIAGKRIEWREYYLAGPNRQAIIDEISALIQNSGPVILRVPGHKGLEGYADPDEPVLHAVLAWKAEGEAIYIRDPGWQHEGVDTDSFTLDDYINFINSEKVSNPVHQLSSDLTWLTQHRITYARALTEDDGAALPGQTYSPIEFVITDPLGRRLGYDPTIDKSYEEIPESIYERLAAVLAPDGDAMPDDGHTPISFRIGEALNGEYTIDVFGIDDGPWAIDFDFTMGLLYEHDAFEFTGTTSMGSYESLSFVVTNVPEPTSLALVGAGGLLLLRRRA